ncbi:hypothetical protein NARC_160121 [Candidatus Nitrosocosmicus arcticus]|uniref:Uncharacterized protein n=2 Tax=Candidatus Nitrosocosmicus arcticus TaxID=2035267 RepID=A0A557SS24_9ARCH|nr:hypothetical protein NARC_160121 [Candidatus Nitrosocosmicus arcticus]
MESFFKKCEIKVLFENKIVGETMQNNYNISHQSNRVELLETISPNLVIENFKGKNFEFACALAHSLCFRHGNIQMVHSKRFKELGSFELVVYYSNSYSIDKEIKEQIMFYHSQNNFDFEYPNPASIMQSANSYFSKKHPD